jgi:hypothetical protein
VLLFGWSLVEGLGAVTVIPAIAALIATTYEGTVTMLLAALGGPRLAARFAPKRVARVGLLAVVVASPILLGTIDVELNRAGFTLGLAVFGAAAVAKSFGDALLAALKVSLGAVAFFAFIALYLTRGLPGRAASGDEPRAPGRRTGRGGRARRLSAPLRPLRDERGLVPLRPDDHVHEDPDQRQEDHEERPARLRPARVVRAPEVVDQDHDQQRDEDHPREEDEHRPHDVEEGIRIEQRHRPSLSVMWRVL